MGNIFGREEECEILNQLFSSEKSEFLAVYGRRRVGKTYLIDRYFRDKGIYFHFTGMKGASLKEHLDLFRIALSKRMTDGKAPEISSWIKGFQILEESIEKIDRSQKVILFFDELPWIVTKRSGFLRVLEHFWNDFLSRNPNVILIVCGSAASWMIKKIVHNRGGFYNRLSAKIRLEPFTLKQTKQYLEGNSIYLNDKQIIDIYMVTGGVAKYLSYIKKGLSSSQIIQSLCFQKNSPLIDEYMTLFSSLFDNYQDHIQIVEALATKRSGMTHSELLQETKKASGGTFTSILEELKEGGFISLIPAFNKKKKEGKFFLCDEYSFFYLTWVKEGNLVNNRPISSDYWMALQGSTKFAAWSGYAFETICRKHISEIIQGLGIQIVAESAVHWHSPKKEGDGAQIDLIIDRRDQCMNLCEIKYYSSEAVFSPREVRQILFKRERFRELSKTKKALFNTLISAYGARENGNFHEAFDNQITADVFFA